MRAVFCLEQVGEALRSFTLAVLANKSALGKIASTCYARYVSVQQQRRERELAEQRRLILTTARSLAETDGWAAVTTRRLADEIEYSQPVLYKHFKGKDGIIEAVALEGFEELTAALRAARVKTTTPDEGLIAFMRTYMDFARRNPSLFDAMFNMSTGLLFAQSETPDALRHAFAEVRSAVAPVTFDEDVQTVTETVWAAVHGLVMLDHSGRLRPSHREQRITVLARQLLARPAAAAPVAPDAPTAPGGT